MIIELKAEQGVRYTVPSIIHIDRMEDTQVVRFRVGGVYANAKIAVYAGETKMMELKKRIMAPGEMEQIKLTKEQLMKYPGLKTITVKIEEA